MAKYLKTLLLLYSLLTKNLFSFRSGDSTTNQLIDLVDEIHKSFDNSCEVSSVFLNIAKALDMVWHEGPIFKLQQNGTNSNLLKLLKNYLADRMQGIVLNYP